MNQVERHFGLAAASRPTRPAMGGSTWRWLVDSEEWAEIPKGRVGFEPEVEVGRRVRPGDLDNVLRYGLEVMDALGHLVRPGE